jgi:hypothetical protein
MRITCRLRHGVRLTIAGVPGSVGVGDVADFLAEALGHFRRCRDVQRRPFYGLGPYRLARRRGRQVPWSLQLSYPGEVRGAVLATGLWVDAVAHAYAVADAVDQFGGDLDALRQMLRETPRAGEHDGRGRAPEGPARDRECWSGDVVSGGDHGEETAIR